MTFIFPSIVFIACHLGAAGHFADLAKELRNEGYTVRILATGSALRLFQDLDLPAEELNPTFLDIRTEENQTFLAEKIAKETRTAKRVITDVGHPLMQKVHKILAEKNPQGLHAAYLDNPELYVAGGYTDCAIKVMSEAPHVLLSNANFAKQGVLESISSELKGKSFRKIGYYPIDKAERIKKARSNKEACLEKRKRFFAEHGLEDKGERLLVYFGGNNPDYFEAFTATLSLFGQAAKKRDFSKDILVLQQHPGAKAEGKDAAMLLAWNKTREGHFPLAIVSKASTEELKLLVDVGLYQQTSMNAELSLAGIPMVQVAHRIYEDVLTLQGIAPSAVTAEELLLALRSISKREDCEERVKQAVGYLPNWKEHLLEYVKE